jgi:hypothetical protein
MTTIYFASRQTIVAAHLMRLVLHDDERAGAT